MSCGDSEADSGAGARPKSRVKPRRSSLTLQSSGRKAVEDASSIRDQAGPMMINPSSSAVGDGRPPQPDLSGKCQDDGEGEAAGEPNQQPQRNTNSHQNVLSYIKFIYNGFATGFATDHAPGLDVGNLQYGEVTNEGMESLHSSLQLNDRDVFYDLGSGVGKLVLYFALRGAVARSVGIEVGERRHALAAEACTRLRDQLDEEKDGEPSLPALPHYSTFDVVLGDARQNTYSDATVIALSNLCMDHRVQKRCLDSILRCPMLKKLACTAPLPPHKRLRLSHSAKVGCSWAKVVAWQVYEVLPMLTKTASTMAPYRLPQTVKNQGFRASTGALQDKIDEEATPLRTRRKPLLRPIQT